MTEEQLDEMCMNVAPAHVALCVPPPPAGEVYLTPWCHLEKGHDGPHRCGDQRWANIKQPGRKGEP